MGERLRLLVRVVPHAPADRLGGSRGGRLMVRVTAAPERGAANRAVQELIADTLGVRVGDVRIEAGASSRDKRLSVPASAADAIARLMK